MYMNMLTLDFKGVILALLMGVVLLFLGMHFGAFFVLAMITFLVLSAIVTYTGIKYKKEHGLGQKPRGVWNVLSNGIPPLIMALLFALAALFGNSSLELLAVIGFVASVAAITADKFGSEIGVLNGKPSMIFTSKKVQKGTSGGITALGTFAGILAAFIIALLLFLVAPQLAAIRSSYGFGLKKSLLIITFSGFFGSLVDSFLGYYEEKGIGNKFTSNLACGIFGGLIAMLLFAVI
jgi:uncharacterized protein (TIGR00297 family)